MHYIVHCLDYEGNVQKRLDHYEAHKAYLDNEGSMEALVISLLSSDSFLYRAKPKQLAQSE